MEFMNPRLLEASRTSWLSRAPLPLASACAAWALLVPAVRMQAQISPLLQTRSVSGAASATLPGSTPGDSDSDAALGFGTFNALVQPQATATWERLVATAQGTGSQNSFLGATHVTAQGEAGTSLSLPDFDGGSASARGESLFDFQFTLASPALFSLSGTLDTQAVVSGGATIPALDNDLIFEDLDNASVLFAPLTDDESFTLNGSLGPGTYRLFAMAKVEASQASSSVNDRTVSGKSSFDLDFRISPIPEPGTATAAILLAVLGSGAWLRGSRPPEGSKPPPRPI